MTVQRICMECKKSFITDDDYYCSDECLNKFFNKEIFETDEKDGE